MMSTQALQRVLARAAQDAAFADLLFADPERALAGYDLTIDEALTLKLMSRSDLTQYAFQSQPPSALDVASRRGSQQGKED